MEEKMCQYCVNLGTLDCPIANMNGSNNACEFHSPTCPQDSNYCSDWENEDGEY